MKKPTLILAKIGDTHKLFLFPKRTVVAVYSTHLEGEAALKWGKSNMDDVAKWANLRPELQAFVCDYAKEQIGRGAGAAKAKRMLNLLSGEGLWEQIKGGEAGLSHLDVEGEAARLVGIARGLCLVRVHISHSEQKPKKTL